MVYLPHQHIIRHFGDESFQPIAGSGTNSTTQNNQETEDRNNTMQKVALVNSTTDTLNPAEMMQSKKSPGKPLS